MTPDSLVYTRTCRIRPHHVNMNQVLRTSSLLRLMQDTSVAHTEALGLTKEKTLEQGLLWVIARQHIVIHRMPVYDEDIQICTWPDKMQHLFFPRRHQVFSADGSICLVEAEALWLLMDQKDRHMVFPSDYELSLPGRTDVSDFPDIPPIRSASDAAAVNQTLYTPRFSQTDLNGHVNNAAYFDLIDDLLPTDYLAAHVPAEIFCEYASEIRPGQTVRLRCLASEAQPDLFWFEGIPESAESSRASFRIRIQFVRS